MCFRSMIVMCTWSAAICKSYAWGRLAAVPHQRMTGGNDLKSRLNLTCSDAPARKTGCGFSPQCVECRDISRPTRPSVVRRVHCRTSHSLSRCALTMRPCVPDAQQRTARSGDRSRSPGRPRGGRTVPPYLTSAPTSAWNRNRPSTVRMRYPSKCVQHGCFPQPSASPSRKWTSDGMQTRQNSSRVEAELLLEHARPVREQRSLDRLARQPAATGKLERRQ